MIVEATDEPAAKQDQRVGAGNQLERVLGRSLEIKPYVSEALILLNGRKLTSLCSTCLIKCYGGQGCNKSPNVVGANWFVTMSFNRAVVAGVLV